MNGGEAPKRSKSHALMMNQREKRRKRWPWMCEAVVWSQGGRDCPGDQAFPGSDPHHVQSSSASPGSQEGPFISTLSSPLWSQEMTVFTQNCQNEKNNQNLANHLFSRQLRKTRKVLFLFFGN